jgi:hypothetical protein
MLLVGTLTILAFCFPVHRDSAKQRCGLAWRVALLAFGPFALILQQRILAPHTHYPMPLVATQLALLAGFARPRDWPPLRTLIAAVALVLAFQQIGVVPASMAQTLAAQLPCRREAQALFSQITDLSHDGNQIYVDPNVPTIDHMPRVSSTWEVNKDYIMQHAFDILVFNTDFHKRYQAADLSYVQRDNPKWAESKAFYEVFDGRGDQISDPRLGSWRKIHHDACSWEIWRRE